ncbi:MULTISPECIES: cohesin domain-containing protein [unclassified Ruminococcus]|uniref:cohesin domain-containing protein n=1 Tax=unclassified Ruminococcus TaxID=2608920 RepID=UPI00210D19BB|nr:MULTISPECIES: cohesin domain-containing protein [unclassified Ruminococcus]MCQ4022156.1 hypothetical protein [Ruminococcus sp. zg-924]MCQ4115554.1 hypothetical protein [Ruminococcus sp. zg-921]
MKRIISMLAAVLILLSATQPVLAAEYCYSLTLNSKVQTGKSFKAQLNVFGGGDVAAAIFTVCFDSSVMELKSAELCDGTDGKLEYNTVGGTTKLVFLNTKGQPLTGEENGIISLKFKALSTPCNAYITLYCEQAVCCNESYLPCSYGVEYPVELADKISGSVSRSSGTKVNSKPSSSSSNSKASSADKGSSISGSESSEGLTQQHQNGIVSLGSKEAAQSNTAYIMLGAVITLCVVCAVFAIYKVGKKHGEAEQAQKAKQSNPDAEQDEKAINSDNVQPPVSDTNALNEAFESDNADLFEGKEK